MTPSPPGRMIFCCDRNRGDASACVQWAVDALSAGADSPSLRILAGLDPPGDTGEVVDYARKALRELNVAIPTGEAALMAFVREIVSGIVEEPETMGSQLRVLHDLYLAEDSPSHLQPFWLLHFAYCDLMDYPSEPQGYWPGAHRGNIHHVVIEECRKWLAANP